MDDLTKEPKVHVPEIGRTCEMWDEWKNIWMEFDTLVHDLPPLLQ